MSNDFKKIALLRGLAGFCRGGTWIFAPIYLLTQVGLNAVEIGFLTGLFVLASLGSSAASGVLTDFKSPKKLAALGFFGVSVYTALLPFTRGLFELAALMVLGGLANDLCATSVRGWGYKLMEKKERGKQVGLMEVWPVGSAAGLISFGLLYPSPIAFLLAAAVAFACSVFALTIKDAKKKVLEETYWSVVFKKEVLLVCAVMFLLSYHFGAENSVLSLYSKQVIGLNDFQNSLLFALGLVFYGSFNYFSAKKFDSTKNLKKIFALALVLSATGMIAYGFTKSFETALIARVVHELGDAIVITYGYYVLAGIGKKERVGGLHGAYVAVSLIGSAIGAFASGFVASAFGLTSAFVVAGAVTLLGLTLLTFLEHGKIFSITGGKTLKNVGGDNSYVN